MDGVSAFTFPIMIFNAIILIFLSVRQKVGKCGSVL
jgi:hypothetical protein